MRTHMEYALMDIKRSVKIQTRVGYWFSLETTVFASIVQQRGDLSFCDIASAYS